MSKKIVCPKGFDCSLLNSCPALKQDCPAGYFCGSYEGNKYQSDLDLNYAKLVTRFQDVDVTNQNKKKYVDVNRTIQSPCLQGFYCPTNSNFEPCTSDHWCPEMAVEPNACDALSLCASEEGVFQVNFFNALIMAILLILAFGLSCVASRRQRRKYQVSSKLEPTSRSVIDKAGQATIPVSVSSELIHVQFKDLVYEVGHGKVVLPGVSGDIPAGQITALLGPTACGKSSLLNMISTGGVGLKHGQVTIKKEDIHSGFKKQLHHQSLSSYVGHVPQEDLFDRELTVRELLLMNALARSRRWLSYEEANEIVDQVLAELAIQHVSESIIGGGENKASNISGGQLKRVNIACELVAVSRPALLLLDEPTAGLDATIAYELMVSLEAIRDKGVTIFMVIQQPRAEIFSRIEHLFMMNQVGGIVFEGKSSQAVTYLETVGYKIGPDTSDADFCLDVLNSIIECQLEDRFLPDALHEQWNEVRDEYCHGLRSTEEANVVHSHNTVMNKQQTVLEKQEEVSEIEGSMASRFLREFWMQAYRLFIVRIRNMNALVMYAFISFVMAIALSVGFTIYLSGSYNGVFSPPTQTVLQAYYPGPISKYSSRNAAGVGFEQLMFFMSSALGSAACLAGVPVFAGKIEVLRRERSAGISVLAFISGALFADCFFVLVNAFVFTGIWCLFGHAGSFYDWMATIICTAFAASAIGYISAASVRKNSASVFAIITTFICCVFAGVEPALAQVERYPVVNWPWYISFSTWTAEACYVTWTHYLTNDGNIDIDLQAGADKYGYVVDEGLGRSIGALIGLGIALRVIAGTIVYYRTKA